MGLELSGVKVSRTHSRTDVMCEYRQTVTQLSHRKVDSLLLRMASINVGTLRGRAGEVVKLLERRSVDVFCVQEVQVERSIGKICRR